MSMTSLPFTSGWQVNELYGLEDEAFGPLLVASDPEVSEVNRRGALSDAIDAVNSADATDPAVLWAALQIVALLNAGLTPLDHVAAEAVENWLVEGEVGEPLVMSARTFGDIENSATRAAVLAGVIAFAADSPAVDAWVEQHMFGAAQLDVVASYLWLEGAEDDDIADRLPHFVDLVGDLLDDWARWSIAHRLHHIDFPMDRVLDQLRVGEYAEYPTAVGVCVQHPFGQQAAALSLTEDPAPQAAATLRELVRAGVPAAPIGLVANIADRFGLSLARAIIPAAEGADRLFVHTLVNAVLEYETLDVDLDDEEADETLMDVASDPNVDPQIRGIIVGALVSNLMDLEQTQQLSDTMAGMSAQMEKLLGKIGMDSSQIPGLAGFPGVPDVAAQRARLNELATGNVVAYLDGGAPEWFTGAWDDLEPAGAITEGPGDPVAEPPAISER